MNDNAQLQTRVKRLEAAQAMLLHVGRLSCTTHDLDEFLSATHQAVGSILYAANFFVALYDPLDSTIRFVYFVDEVDAPEDPTRRFPLHAADESPTAWVILKGEPLNLTTAERAQYHWAAAAWHTGTDSAHWIGMPLHLSDGKILGALVIQSYRADRIYTDEDIALFGQIADHISTTLEKLTATQRLEQAITERTRELEHEIAVRRKAEELQRGLYEIAALCATDATLDEVYRTVHDVTSRLLYARNFFIMLHHEEEQEFNFPYSVDEFEQPFSPDLRFPIWRGLTSYVVRTRQPQLVDPGRRAQLVLDGEIKESLGHLGISSWMGAPMIVAERVYGVIVVQSYDPTIRHNASDLELLAYMATHVAGSLSRRDADAQLRAAAETLSLRNAELTTTLDQLRNTQGELVRQEKLASLGGLVAGIAHEINTPLGICITATTHVQRELLEWRKWLEAGILDATRIDVMLDDLGVAMHILENNIRRGAELVRSFKQVAVDQSSGHRRTFDLSEYLDEVLLSLRPTLKHAPCSVKIDCRSGIWMDSFPGALSQIVTNLTMNALVHAFDGRQEGVISIRGELDGEFVLLSVCDDGNGMNATDLKQVFDPFFTTKRGSGGTGLGAHIVFNQVTNVLEGTIKATSAPGAGTQVHMRLPRMLGKPGAG
ncbi:MAG TPA: GAF domain-containing sensor histidine kinase [Xanthomonadaceae bacterium]|jgi:signal transduction histidine kinase|nr:GAF domain-containing sensor histidine kinase [Xanthomonadaceae bacterium]